MNHSETLTVSIRSLNNSSTKCPICRAPISNTNISINRVLKEMIEKKYPQITKKIKREQILSEFSPVMKAGMQFVCMEFPNMDIMPKQIISMYMKLNKEQLIIIKSLINKSEHMVVLSHMQEEEKAIPKEENKGHPIALEYYGALVEPRYSYHTREIQFVGIERVKAWEVTVKTDPEGDLPPRMICRSQPITDIPIAEPEEQKRIEEQAKAVHEKFNDYQNSLSVVASQELKHSIMYESVPSITASAGTAAILRYAASISLFLCGNLSVSSKNWKILYSDKIQERIQWCDNELSSITRDLSAPFSEWICIGIVILVVAIIAYFGWKFYH